MSDTCGKCGEYVYDCECGNCEVSLATVNQIEPAELIARGGLDILKAELVTRYEQRPTDASTEKGRSDITKFAFKFSKDGTLVSDIVQKVITERSKAVEQENIQIHALKQAKKKFKQFCIDKRKEAREPVTKWEEAEAEKERLLELELSIERDWEDAHNLNRLMDLEAADKARKAREAQEAHEAQIAKEAADKAKADAAQAIEDAKAAEAKAIADKEAAVAQAKWDAEQIAMAEAQVKEDARLAEEVRIERLAEEQRQEKARIAGDKEHQRQVNNEIVKDFWETLRVSEQGSKQIVVEIIKGNIRHVKIQY